VEVLQRTIQIGEAVIRRKFSVTAVKFFMPFIARLKIVCRPIRSNRFSSGLNVLELLIDSINIHVSRKDLNTTKL